MTRRIAILFSLLLAFSLFADSRIAETRPASAATVTGTVSAVNGKLIQLANGRITIDATNAKIHGASTIEVGMLVTALLSTSDVAPNAPLPASAITAIPVPDATLTGPVQSVDVSASTLTLLGRTIRVTPDTSFGGIRKSRDGERPTLADVLPNQVVAVTADEVNGQLVAKSILIVSHVVPEVRAVRGTVVSIGTDAWVIDTGRDNDVTVKLDAQTKIVNSPKVGDQVEVLYRVDTANAFIAITIIKLELPNPPFVRTFRVTGTVVSIAATQWVVEEKGERVTLKIGDQSRIEPGIVAGDGVDVLAQKNEDGSATALVIIKKRWG